MKSLLWTFCWFSWTKVFCSRLFTVRKDARCSSFGCDMSLLVSDVNQPGKNIVLKIVGLLLWSKPGNKSLHMIEDRGNFGFFPVCHSVILSETLTLLLTFNISSRVLTFHMNIPCDKTLLSWTWSLTYFLKTLILLHVTISWK